MNSRSLLAKNSSTQTPETPSTSRNFKKLLENVYKPGFIDKTTTESLKMSVDHEFAEISKALFKTAERETDLGEGSENMKEEIRHLEIRVEDNYASITHTDRVVADLSSATAESLTELRVEIGENYGDLTQKLSVVGDKINGIESEWSITSDINGKVAGVQLINGSNKKSEFNVLADVFKVSHGADDGIAPFEIEGGKTKIKNAVVGTISSDNWDGNLNGWSIQKNGNAVFNNVVSRGHIEATTGSLDNVRIRKNCVIEGTAFIADAQVDTLQIAGQAVTIPVFRENSFAPAEEITNTGDDVDVGMITPNVVYNAPGKVVFSVNGVVEGTENTNFGVLMRVWRDGVPFSEKRYNSTAPGGNTISTSFVSDFDLPFSGVYGFQVLVFNNWSGGTTLLKHLSMTILGVKR